MRVSGEGREGGVALLCKGDGHWMRCTDGGAREAKLMEDDGRRWVPGHSQLRGAKPTTSFSKSI